MKAGDTLSGRWELLVEAPGEPEVARWRAVDRQTGEPVEVLALRPPEVHRPPAHAAFARAHRAIRRSDDPAVARTIAVVDDAGPAFVVRAPLEDATLDEVSGPLAAEAVAAIGARLLPAVVAAGAASGGALTARDVGLDASGAPVLALRARPSARVSRDDTRWVAPEAFRGAEADGAAGLYGLGVLLHRLATGRDPLRPSGPDGALPRPSASRPGLPPALDDAILRLLSTDPVRRASALPLLHEVAGPLPDLRAHVGARAARRVEPGALVLTTTGRPSGPGGREDVAEPGALVVLDVAELTPAARSAAAGEATVPLALVEELAAAGLPLVVATARTAREAARRADALRAAGLPARVATGSGCVGPAVAIGSVPAALLAGLLAWALGAPALLIPMLVAVAVGVAAVAVTARGRAARRRLGEVRARHEGEVRRHAAEPELAPLWGRVAALRRQLAALDLPETAALDLRSALKDVEKHLDDVARVGETARETLSRVDLPALRTRLRGIVDRAGRDPAAAAERDRLARTVADLEAVEARARAVRGEAARIAEALDELAGVLGTVGTTDAGSAAVERLVHTTRLARASLAGTEPPRRAPQREAQ